MFVSIAPCLITCTEEPKGPMNRKPQHNTSVITPIHQAPSRN